MPYALFIGEGKITDTYLSRSDLWRRAKEAGLVHEQASGTRIRRHLDDGFELRRCQFDMAEQ